MAWTATIQWLQNILKNISGFLEMRPTIPDVRTLIVYSINGCARACAYKIRREGYTGYTGLGNTLERMQHATRLSLRLRDIASCALVYRTGKHTRAHAARNQTQPPTQRHRQVCNPGILSDLGNTLERIMSRSHTFRRARSI